MSVSNLFQVISADHLDSGCDILTAALQKSSQLWKSHGDSAETKRTQYKRTDVGWAPVSESEVSFDKSVSSKTGELAAIMS